MKALSSSGGYSRETPAGVSGRRRRTRAKKPEEGEYHFKKIELAVIIPSEIIIIILTAYLFYKSIIAAIMLAPLCIPITAVIRRHLKEHRDKKTIEQFADGMDAYISALRAGYSAESSIREATRQLTRIYGRDCAVAAGFSEIMKGLSVNETIEDLFDRFARRTGIPEIKRTAAIFRIAKRNGGILVTVLEDCLRGIRAGERLTREVDASSAAKKAEFAVMALMPPAMLIYMNVTSPEYMSPLYSGFAGKVIMSVIFIAYAGALFAGERLASKRL